MEDVEDAISDSTKKTEGFFKYVFKMEMTFVGFWDLFKKIFITNSVISTVYPMFFSDYSDV